MTYDWFKVPASIHEVLAHAGEIITNLPVPLGLIQAMHTSDPLISSI